VTTSPGCTYTATAPPGSFASITSGAFGSGSGTVTYNVQGNSGGASRITALTIAGLTFTIDQVTGCVLGLTPSSAAFPATLAGGSQIASFNVTSTGSNCGFSAASTNTSFLVVNPNISGLPTVSYTITSNPRNAGRTATILVTGQGGAQGQSEVFTVVQAGLAPCTYALTKSTQSFLSSGGTGTVNVEAPAGCPWSASSNSPFVSVGGGGSGNGTLTYTVSTNSGSTSRIGSLTVAGLPYAVNQAGATNINCTGSSPNPAPAAMEGRTELLGDYLLTCTGMTAPVTANIALRLNTNVTNATASGVSDAFLQVNGAATTSGMVSGFNSLQFNGVSLVPSGGGVATVRVTNVRADASMVGSSGSLQSLGVTGTITVDAGVPVPITNATQILAYAAQTLIFVEGAANTTTSGSSPGESTGLSPRASGGTSGATTTIPFMFQEASPGAFHTGTAPTRLRLVLNNVPAAAGVCAPVFNSDAVVRAQLVTADSNGAGGAPVGGQVGSCSGLTANNGTINATWVVNSSDPNSFETNTFPMIFGNVTAQDLSGMTVSATYAPVSQVSVATAAGFAPIPRFRDFSVPQSLVNLRSTSVVVSTPASSSLAGGSMLDARLKANAAGGTGGFGNQTNNDDQDNPSMGTTAQSTVSGGTITDCQIQQPASGSCSVSSDGTTATATMGQLDPSQTTTYVISVQPNPCPTATCAVQEDVTVTGTSPNADVTTSHSSSVFTVTGSSGGCTPGQPGSMNASGGNNQSATVNSPFAAALQVTLTDTCGSPMAGQTITFSAPGSGASANLSPGSATTNSSGVASVNATANGTAGGYTVTARFGSLSVNFSLTNMSGGGGGSGAASQSSTFPGSPAASAAFDNNTDGNYFDGSVTATNTQANPWWQVDLGSSKSISTVVIWNRTDCCASRLSDYWVFVSNTPFSASDTPTTLASRPGTFASHQTSTPSPSATITVGASGQYVRVQLSGTDILSLAEVQVNTGGGTGGGGTASQSSTFPGSPAASAAIDGRTDGNYFDGSVTATNMENNPWWQEDLGSSQSISSITIWNRTDCCGSRLSDYWVFVSNTPFSAADTPATLANRAGTFASHQTTAPSPSTTIAVNTTGQFVRVQLSSPNILSLAEVQVATGGGSTNADLAQGKPASQSSTLAGTPPASVVVDGNTDGNFYDGSVTATNPDPFPWWQVDLGASVPIGTVFIWNRTDCCGSRLSDYWVFFSNTPFAASDTPATLQNRAGTASLHLTNAPSPSQEILLQGLSYRYIRVQLSSSNYLSLAEVQVFAPVNVSPGKTASQSSTLPFTPPASVAVDGNTDGNFYDGSVTATNQENNPWWQVDLGASTPVSNVVVWNRTDCCSTRLGDYWVFVSDTPFQASDTPATLVNRAGTFSAHQTTAPSPSASSFIGGHGRYVRVQLSSPNILSLAEVQVFVY